MAAPSQPPRTEHRQTLHARPTSEQANMDNFTQDETTAGLADDSIAAFGSISAVPRIVAEVGEQRNRIIANWALRVANLPAFRAMPDLPLGDVQRHIPEVLE